MVARDSEGATKFVTIDVTGARSWEDARQIGRTIATSALVKTAIYGTDANWGRIFMAAGRAGVELNPDTLALWFGDVQLTANGAPLAYSEADAHATLLGDEVFIRLDLRMGDEHATVWTCDFGPDYVSINADYRT
jgi:glutamate N-acetyltransferase/amino-acid N-acetyltransferase